jgi:hypothetical protein
LTSREAGANLSSVGSSSPRLLRCAILLAAWALLCGRDARGAEKKPAAVGRGQKSYCTRLFGDKRARAANATRRRAMLQSIKEERSGITVIHSNEAWENPREASIEGLELAGRWPKGASKVLVRVDEELAGKAGCAAGVYVVTTDDALGEATRILAVLHEVVLLERDERLRYLAPSGVERPNWLTAYQVKGSIPSRPRRGGR